jgi:hypothetical protein
VLALCTSSRPKVQGGNGSIEQLPDGDRIILEFFLGNPESINEQ